MFERFPVTPADLLGKGSESEVYALDELRVVRLYRSHTDVDYIQQRLTLYDLLHQQRPPFELPLILDQGIVEDRFYTIERRMCGRAFADMLPTLAGDERKHALASYIDVVEQIGEIQFPDQPFGEMLTSGTPTRRTSWPQYLWDRLQHIYHVSRPDVEQDVPGIDVVLAYIREELLTLEGFGEKRLVHGDYFPGNVFIDNQATICGVGDFGYSTIVGDRRMDLAGAVAFLEVVDGYEPGDTAFMLQLVEARHGTAMLHWLEFYRLYYAFYFSTCKLDDPRTYHWCIDSLRSWLATHPAS